MYKFIGCTRCEKYHVQPFHFDDLKATIWLNVEKHKTGCHDFVFICFYRSNENKSY